MCKPERKENKKHDAWNRKHYGKKLAKMYQKLSKIERKFVLSRLNNRPRESLTKEYVDYLDKCFKACHDKYFWRGDAYYMRG